MTEFDRGEQQPRPDTWTVLGLAALTNTDYDYLLRELHVHGLTVLQGEGGAPVTETTTKQNTATESGGVALTAPESSPRLRVLTKDVMTEYDASHPRPDDTTLTVKVLWQRLHRAVSSIEEAKKGQKYDGDISEVAKHKRDALASLPLYAVPGDTLDELPGNRAIDMQSLDATLRMLLEKGYPAAGRIGMLRGFGAGTLDFFAGLVNVYFRPEIPLPRFDDVAAGLEPLPPMYPRTIRTDSPFMHEIMQGQQRVAVVSRDVLHAFAVASGMPANKTGHLLRLIEDLATMQLGEDPIANQTAPHWIHEDVCYLREHKVVGGSQDRAVWGIRFPTFIEAFYELERDTELRRQVAGFGPQVRQLLRQYLHQVAPYTPQ